MRILHLDRRLNRCLEGESGKIRQRTGGDRGGDNFEEGWPLPHRRWYHSRPVVLVVVKVDSGVDQVAVTWVIGIVGGLLTRVRHHRWDHQRRVNRVNGRVGVGPSPVGVHRRQEVIRAE